MKGRGERGIISSLLILDLEDRVGNQRGKNQNCYTSWSVFGYKSRSLVFVVSYLLYSGECQRKKPFNLWFHLRCNIIEVLYIKTLIAYYFTPGFSTRLENCLKK